MKLPGINYQTVVGPDTSGLPLQTARAWASAADNWATAIDGVVRQTEEIQAEEAVIGAAAEAAEIERIVKRGVWDVSELGEPPTDLRIATRDKKGPQQIYRMHEFGDQYYDKRVKEIGDRYGKELSGRARRAFNKKFMNSVAAQRNRVMESQYKQAQSHQKGIALKALEMATQTVDWNSRYDVVDTANELVNGLYRNGHITLEEVVKEQAKYRDIVMENAYRRAISEAGDDITDLRNIEFLASQEPMMNDKTRDRFATLVERKINRIERRLMDEDKERRKQNDADIRLRYYKGEDVQGLLLESRATGSPEGQRSFQDLVFVRGDTSTRFSDPDTRAMVEEWLAVAEQTGPNMDEALDTIDRQLGAMSREPNPPLSADDIRRFSAEVQELRLGSEIFKTEDYNTTDSNMYMDIVGQSKLSNRRPEKTQLARYRDAEDDLREWLLDNPRGSASQWWRQNAELYERENWWDRKIGLSGVPREYVITNTRGEPHIKKSEKAANDALRSGDVDDDEYQQIMLNLKRLERDMTPQ